MSTPDPKGFTYNPTYEPDRDRMLKALQAVLVAPKRREDEEPTKEQENAESGGVA
ncbi:hypothetical protein [Cohnella lubricantis]|uniref:Uncharacterized protein n=1 Tax=Cohnella lubricantis TaxID=2163172 RepID=A0A841T573_9BACL|nr:hypothetical protein [Cohnella lubricantis]MBB6676464.1 hypothetical protein [Cohnella lubricantis]MBP2117080.1 hypothetical protein [Cohnella lubricantis]